MLTKLLNDAGVTIIVGLWLPGCLLQAAVAARFWWQRWRKIWCCGVGAGYGRGMGAGYGGGMGRRFR
jgi:hypothetical protein